MCDYSLHHVSSRPAKVSDKLVTTELSKSSTRGFAAVGEYGAKLVVHDDPPKVAVCLLPGTELAFDADVRYDRPFFRFFSKAHINHKVARFRQIDLDDPHVQHDALEFPNGEVLKLAQLVAGQTATVLQLPITTQRHEHVETARARASDSRVVMNRAFTLGTVMPNQGAAMLWQALCSTAVELSTELSESFRRLTAPKQHPILVDIDGEGSFEADALMASLPRQSPTQKPDKKIDAQAAA